MFSSNRNIFFLALLLIFTILSGTPAFAAETANPVEIGDVHWRRDFKEVLNEGRKTGKPVFLLFQEVPG